jgi:hypothetical protein
MRRRCQSCGMPFAKDPEGGGTDAGGSRSRDYCSYCYKDGVFTDGFSTARQMQAFVRARLRQQGFPRLLAWLFASDIPRLTRWKMRAGRPCEQK